MNADAAYRKTQAEPAATLVARHTELVRRIAHHLAARLPASVDVDDLMQAGMVGLIEAGRQYEAGHGASFETYASIRIRGAMLDELRRGTWSPRSVNRRVREAADAIRQIEQQRGRPAETTEVAIALGISVDDYHDLLADAARGQVLSLDDTGPEGAEPKLAAETHEPSPEAGALDQEFQQVLAQAIAALPQREALVLSLYYEQELNLREIGAVLGVTESRVCQLHGQALLRLRARIHADAGGTLPAGKKQRGSALAAALR